MKYSKVVTVFILILVCLITAPHFSSVVATEHFVTDPCTDTNYTLSYDENKVTIKSGHTYDEFFIDNEIRAATCYNGNFAFLCTFEKEINSYRYMIYFYNIHSDNLKFYSTDCNASTDNKTFATDSKENTYLTDTNDRRKVYICSKNNSAITVNCPDYINQLMCPDGECVLAFTAGGVYILADYSFTKITGIHPTAPCRYSKDNIITDTNSVEYKYKNKSLYAVSSDNTSDLSPSTPDITIVNNCIFIPNGMTYAKLCKLLDVTKNEFVIFKQNTAEFDNGKLGTGMYAEYTTDRYTIVVIGDLTGEGNVNSKDLKSMMKHLTGENSLGTYPLMAADINRDKIASTKDLLLLAKLY